MLFKYSIFVCIGDCLSTGGIIGVAIGPFFLGIIVGVLITIIAIIIFKKYCQKKNNKQGENDLQLQGHQFEDTSNQEQITLRNRNGRGTWKETNNLC